MTKMLRYGGIYGCAGSRFLNGTLDLHLQLEEKLAKFSVDRVMKKALLNIKANPYKRIYEKAL